MSFEDFLNWHNIVVKIVTLPFHIKGFAYYNGINYLVIINSRCSSIQQEETLIHELIHIFKDHFSCPIGYEELCEKQVYYFIKNLNTDYR